ncbi:glycosyltransferase family 4 protein [Rhizobium sp. P40RR-XXII]|uniref:glycosyltransferase family 4 protein n=1 Tax=unclassified Rhizobium TaxID=2613769 RepID=UPI001456DF17|nr:MULTISPECIES: glycosyltransferase family 4 protein [unclassified Rhizobium]NLR84627.1 glycosyltransferase family 4 protein [Rhizobium sp. P28RR-XV]NLS16466.1 glycosyltransferase family 4 protein [Rhizobium sp. P40RR-XXII]
MLHILYFVHDLADPAVRRRVLMLQAGGALVTLAGFRRDDNALAAIHGVEPIELGKTQDAQFAQRVAAVARSAAKLRSALRFVARPDVIIGRNLEMLTLANRAKSVFGGDMPIVYECLDIHRLLLRNDVVGGALRSAERHFGSQAALLITSSPAFVERYFRPRSGLHLPVMLLENKVLTLEPVASAVVPIVRPPAAGKPWKIGWFGALRCRKSLTLLDEFSRRMEGRFEVVLRGRPAYSEFDDFDGFVRKAPFMHFAGAYKNPEDLQAIYNDVQFSWAIDFFEEGLNSSWLLPNRLYEGGLYGAVPIAMEGTETARFLASRKIGLTLDAADATRLTALLGEMDEQRYVAAFDAVASQDRTQWMIDRADCHGLVQRLASLTRANEIAELKALPQLHRNRGGLQ